MGLLFTTEGTRRLLDTVNTAFAVDGLKIIRNAVKVSHSGDRKLYNMVANPPWKKGHLATTLELFPYKQDGGGLDPDSKARWAFFLKTVLAGKFDDLCKALSEVLLETTSVTIVSVSFSHVEKTGSPNLVVYDAPLTNDLNGDYGRHITLFTRRVKDTGETDTFDPPDIANDGPPLSPPWKKP